jgi:hypothetical protein
MSPDVKRWRKANSVESRPAFRLLIEILTGMIPDSAVVVPPNDPDINMIVSSGEFYTTKGRRVAKMAANSCHRNTSALYSAGKIDKIVTGYALSDDLGWRSHTFGLKNGKVVETTYEYDLYYGIELGPRESKRFVLENPTKERL